MTFTATVCLLFLTHLSLPAQTVSPDSIARKYVWHTEGIPLYRAPQLTADSIGQLGYGDEVIIAGIIAGGTVGVNVYTNVEEGWESDEYVNEYLLPSNWVKVEHGGLPRYVLNTYLSDFPPPDSTQGATFIIEEYLQHLSTVAFKKNEGQTETFCSQSILHFENGIRYTFTDFGPCEQCGHVQHRLYLPLATKEEALMIALHFFNRYGLFLDENTVLLKKDGKDVELEGYMEYGQAFIMRIIEQENGALLIEDLYL